MPGALEKLRGAADLTQGELASKAGVSRDTITKLETGKRSSAHASTVGKLAKALGAGPEELAVRGDREPPPGRGARRPALRLARDPGAPAASSSPDGGFGVAERKVRLEVSERELASALEAFWGALEELPEDTPLEAYENLAVVGYVAKGLPIALAREQAAKFARGA